VDAGAQGVRCAPGKDPGGVTENGRRGKVEGDERMEGGKNARVAVGGGFMQFILLYFNSM